MLMNVRPTALVTAILMHNVQIHLEVLNVPVMPDILEMVQHVQVYSFVP